MTSSGREPLAVFPLGTVLFPGGTLPLRIFEPRYIDMVSRCMKTQRPFAVVAINEGREVGPTPDFFNDGTLATIISFDQTPEGLLHIETHGGQRCQIESWYVHNDGLVIADEYTSFAEDGDENFDSAFTALAERLEQAFEQSLQLAPPRPWHFHDPHWVAYRYAERLPLSPADKVAILTATTGYQKLSLVNAVLHPN